MMLWRRVIHHNLGASWFHLAFLVSRALAPLLLQDEIFRLRAAHLKKEEKDVQELEQQLDVQRKLHIRFSKRMSEERLSPFAGHPVLHSRFLLLHLLGKGGFSEVFKAFDLKTRTYTACKIHQLNPTWTVQRKDSYVRHATREYNIHTSLAHPRVVKLIEVRASRQAVSSFACFRLGVSFVVTS